MHAGIIATPVAAPPAAVSRQYFVAQTLGSASNLDATTWTNHATLTFTPDNGRDYVLFWMAELSNTSPTGVIVNGAEVQLAIDAAQVDLATHALNPDRWSGEGGMHKLTGAGVPVTATLDFRRHSDTQAAEASWIRNARIVALRLESGDEWSEDLTEQGNVTGAFADACTLSFTPASTRSYILFGAGQLRNAATPEVRLWDGTIGQAALQPYNSDLLSFVQMWLQPGLSGPQTFHLQHRTVMHTTGITSYIRHSRMLALDLSGFSHAYHTELVADTPGGTGAWADVLTLSRTIASDDYLVLSAWGHLQTSGSASSLSSRVKDPTGALDEVVDGPKPISDCPVPGFVASVGAFSAGARQWSLQSRGDGGPGPSSVVRASAVLAVFKLN